MTYINLISFYNRFSEYPSKYSLSSMRLAASILDITNIDVKISTYDLIDNDASIAEDIIKTGANIIGLPVYMWTAKKSKNICEILAKQNKKIILVAGGPDIPHLDVSTWPDNTIFVIGEGEEPLRDLLANGSDLINKPSRSSLNSGHNRRTIIAPKHDLFTGHPLYSTEFEKVFVEPSTDNRFTWHDTAVGCRYKCGYCGHKTRPTVSFRPDWLVQEEIKNIGRRGFAEVFVIDPVLGGNSPRDLQILEWYNQFAPNAKLRAYYRPEGITEETIALLKKSNIKEILLGLQTTNHNVPRWLRNNNFDLVRKRLPLLSHTSINTRVELIIGLPGDNYFGLRESLRFVTEEISPTAVYAYHLTVIPGTRLFEHKDALDKPIWVCAEPISRRATSSNSYEESQMEHMLKYAGAITSLYNSLVEKKRSSHVPLKQLELLVEEIFTKTDAQMLSAFQKQDMVSAKKVWEEYLK